MPPLVAQKADAQDDEHGEKTVMSTVSEMKMTRAAVESSPAIVPCWKASTIPTMSIASTGTTAAPLTMHRMPNTLSGRGILPLDAGGAFVEVESA